MAFSEDHPGYALTAQLLNYGLFVNSYGKYLRLFFSYFVRRALRSSLLRMYRTRRRKFLKLRKP